MLKSKRSHERAVGDSSLLMVVLAMLKRSCERPRGGEVRVWLSPGLYFLFCVALFLRGEVEVEGGKGRGMMLFP